MKKNHATVEAALALPIPAGARSAQVLAHGSMKLRISAPKGDDRQTPHTQDEVYVVVRGTGWFSCARARRKFGPGDVLFAAAGEEHRFEDFSDDFVTWVIFYGPEGGESSEREEPAAS